MLTAKARKRAQRNRRRKMQQHIPNPEIAGEIEEGFYKAASYLKIHYITATLRKSHF
ncbi:hypothetical protein M433DRAFT_154250, partial [Acidomyces richmondensis BFW]